MIRIIEAKDASLEILPLHNSRYHELNHDSNITHKIELLV